TSETIDRDRETGSAVDRAQVTLAGVEQHPHRAVCGGGRFTCRARIRTTPTGQIQSFASLANVQGFGPPDLQAAYKINTQGGQNATIAIVDAFGYKNAESDLATYRSQFGLPPCTIANGCLKIVNQTGQTSPLPPEPSANDDWTVETALDLDMA